MSSLAVNSNTLLWDGSSIGIDSTIKMSITDWYDNQTIHDLIVLDDRRYPLEDGSINHIVTAQLVDSSVVLSFDLTWRNGTLRVKGWPQVDLDNYPNMLRIGKSYRIMSITGHDVIMAQYMKINDKRFQNRLRSARLPESDSYEAHFPLQLPGEHNAQNLRF